MTDQDERNMMLMRVNLYGAAQLLKDDALDALKRLISEIVTVLGLDTARGESVENAESVATLTKRHERHLAIVVDQARQIAELREELTQVNARAANDLIRQSRNWDDDRREGLEQVRRLVEENQKMRLELFDLKQPQQANPGG